jgi:hypothetical protein
VDEQEAAAVGEDVLAEYRRETYESLRRLLREPESRDVVAASGVVYQVEVNAVWDGAQDGDLRVMAAVDDGTFRRATVPLGGIDFVMAPDGSFVGED